MDNLLINFLEKIESLDEQEYMEKFIGYMLSPVITGIKPASTINLKDCRKSFFSYWKKNSNYILEKYNLESIDLQETHNSIIILVYDRLNLSQHLKIKKNHNFLCELGYSDFQLERCLNCLKNKIINKTFPHESGIFLGIPYDDVIGFMNGEKCLFRGYWKVYSSDSKHKEIFSLYDKSRKKYMLNILKNKGNRIKNLYVNHRQVLYS